MQYRSLKTTNANAPPEAVSLTTTTSRTGIGVMARPGLRQHPKFRRLVHVLGEPVPHVLGYLECMWSVGYECGDSLLGDETDVELAAEYPGLRGKLCAALLDCRLIDQVDGKYHIHDLHDHAPKYVQRRMKLELQRRQNGQTISDMRRAAAMKRWVKTAEAPDEVNGMQTDASGHPIASGSMQTDASGCNSRTRTQAPNRGMNPHVTPSCPAVAGRESAGKKKKRCEQSMPPGFEEFWAAWPKKVDKQEAIKEWVKLSPGAELQAVILTALQQHKCREDWLKEGGKYILYPARWLKRRRWEDNDSASAAPTETDEERDRRVRATRAAMDERYGFTRNGESDE
jgi:hypothetical protein